MRFAGPNACRKGAETRIGTINKQGYERDAGASPSPQEVAIDSRTLTVSPLALDVEICRGCDMCVLACSLQHYGQCNPALARLLVTRVADRYAFTVQLCLHCSDPACMAACLDEAMDRDREGIVHILEDRCVACGNCQEACPYDAIFYHREREVYLKCDLCRGRAAGPVCVEVCPTGALSLAGFTRGEGEA